VREPVESKAAKGKNPVNQSAATNETGQNDEAQKAALLSTLEAESDQEE
jgi:hypothetical protein